MLLDINVYKIVEYCESPIAGVIFNMPKKKMKKKQEKKEKIVEQPVEKTELDLGQEEPLDIEMESDGEEFGGEEW